MNWSVGKIGTIYQKPAHAIGLSTPPIGCVLYLPGLPGGGNKIYDRSPYGNNGTITGAVWKRLPSGLWYLDFDGTDDKVDCGTMGSLGSQLGSNTVTILVWVNIPSGTTAACAVCGTINDGSTTMIQLIINEKSDESAETGGLNVTMRDEDGNLMISGVDSDTGIVDGSFHLLAVIINGAGNSVTFYVDTALQTTAYSQQQTPDNTADFGYSLYVGARNIRSTPADFLKGGIALPKICLGELSALEIQNYYQQEKYLFGVW